MHVLPCCEHFIVIAPSTSITDRLHLDAGDQEEAQTAEEGTEEAPLRVLWTQDVPV